MSENINYVLIAIPEIALSIWAQTRISHAYAVGTRIPAASGLNGAEAAAVVMREGGVSGVTIERAAGELSDHYDPRGKVLRLSAEVYAGRSLAALGVAAHEAGHAIQHASGYPGLVVRNLIVPLASIGSTLFWVLILGGLVLDTPALIAAALILFSLTVLLQLVNLPVEFNASRRGRELLQALRLTSAAEDHAIAKVLNAAPWTYVGATLTSLWNFLLIPFHRKGVGIRFTPKTKRRRDRQG